MWYQNWIPVIEKYCVTEAKRKADLINGRKTLSANDIVKIIVAKGYKKFNRYWLERLWKHGLKIDREKTELGFFDQYNHFIWFEAILPLAEEYCKANSL